MSPAAVGAKCPTFEPGELTWLKGDPTPLPVPGQPCVIELWASWCGPCRQISPHLSQIQREYGNRGLVVIGVSIEEDSPQLRAFVQQNSSKMLYKVAQSERVGQQLMQLAQVSGIPHSFVLDSGGTIQYSGHPGSPDFLETIKKVTILARPAVERQPLPRITASREELSATPVRQLKDILQARSIGFVGLSEKSELVDRILKTCSNVTYYAKAPQT